MISGWLPTLALLAGVAAAVAVVVLWVVNYRKTDNAPDATRRTSRKVVGVVSGAVIAIAIAIAELAGLLGVVGDVVTMFPGGATQLALGALAIAGFNGWIEVGAVGFTLLVVGVLAASTAFTN